MLLPREWDVLELMIMDPVSFTSGTWKDAMGQGPWTLLHTSLCREAVLMMSKPTLPPNVLGFQYSGEQMGFPIRPLREKGAPISTMVSPKMASALGFSTNRPV